MEEIQIYLDEAKESMEKFLVHLGFELSKIRTGKAMPNMLDGLMVEYYGSPTPIQQVAAVTVPDARSLCVKPFEKQLLKDIERAIINSNLGFNPSNDGEMIRINLPMLTEERRIQLVKQAKSEADTGKVRIRNIRKEINDDLRKLIKEGAAEDAIKEAEAKVQKLTDAYIVKIDDVLARKEVEIMTV